MEMAEREQALKESEQRRELEATIGLIDFIGDIKELSNRGKDVHPGAKNRKDLQNVAKCLRVSSSAATRRKTTSSDADGSIYNEDEYPSDSIDLLSRPRTFLHEGVVSKREPDGVLSFRSASRYLFLFSDVLLITYKKDSKKDAVRKLDDVYDINHVIWMKDLRLFNISNLTENEDPTAFEIIVIKNRYREQINIQFTCENINIKNEWIREISYTLYAYHQSSSLARQVSGWFHSLVVGTLHSAAFMGDLVCLKKIVKRFTRQSDLDTSDRAGMSALHWAVLNGHETCVRFLLERGCDIDRLNNGLNTPFLLACCRGHDSVARLLLDKGADLFARNLRDCDAVIMAVVYGHATKGLPWVLQLLTARGLDLNGAHDHKTRGTPLHLCAERNLARPVRMLVDSGADVNAKHEVSRLTPLQMACRHAHPDVETVRSFLDKGAYPNWRGDSGGKSAFEIIIREQNKFMIGVSLKKNSLDMNGGGGGSTNFDSSRSSIHDFDEIPLPPSTEAPVGQSPSPAGTPSGSKHAFEALAATPPPRGSFLGGRLASAGSAAKGSFRNTREAVEQVGEWAVEALPTLLEIAKRGGRFDAAMPELDCLRPSFREAILEARGVWERAGGNSEASTSTGTGAVAATPGNSKFLEFVTAREQAGESLLCDKDQWSKDDSSPHCLLCAEKFGLQKKLRRHHCRACGVLVCDQCSSKRLQLSTGGTAVSAANTPDRSGSAADTPGRVCDGCFNRLVFESTQPSPDHYRVRHLKMCATDLMNSIADLVDALDDPDGDPNSFNSAIRATAQLTRELSMQDTRPK